MRKPCLYPLYASAALLACVALVPGCTVPRPVESPASRTSTSQPTYPPSYPFLPTPGPGAPARPNPFYLGPASSALVAQAQTQASGRDYALAAATLERALRIEPGNPLLWIELGRIRLREGNAAQGADLGRKALALATGDPAAQASAQRLIAEARYGGTR